MMSKKNKIIYNEKFEKYSIIVFIGLFFGIVTIMFIIWSKVLREVLSKELADIKINSFSFWWMVASFIIFVIMFCVKLNAAQRQIRGLPFKIKNKYIKDILKRFMQAFPKIIQIGDIYVKYISNSPHFLWRYFYHNTEFKHKNTLLELLLKIGDKILPYYRISISSKNPNLTNFNINRILLTTILFYYLPRLLVTSIFCFEIIFHRELKMFYYFSFLIMISITFNSIRRMIFEHAYYEHERVAQHVEMKSQTYDESLGLQTLVLEKEPYKFMDYNLFLSEAAIYMRTFQIRFLMYTFMEQTDKYNLFFSVFIYAILALSMGVWLLKILHIIAF